MFIILVETRMLVYVKLCNSTYPSLYLLFFNFKFNYFLFYIFGINIQFNGGFKKNQVGLKVF